MAHRPQVVLTGAGVVSPLGSDLDALWEALLRRQSAVRPLPELMPDPLPVRFGSYVGDFDPKPHVAHRKSLKLMSREIQLAVAAANLAMQQAGLQRGSIEPERFGVEFGANTMLSDLGDLSPAYRKSADGDQFVFDRWGGEAMREMNPLWMLKYLPNMPACHIGIAYDAQGPSNSVVQGDLSGLLAITGAVRAIERGQADVMITGGTSSELHVLRACSRHLTEELSRRADQPAEACRPFDAGRDGQVLGEGAAAFVLERKEHAIARGASILGVISGYGLASEGVKPGGRTRGRGVRNAMRAALSDAKLQPTDLGYVKAHGLATLHEDRIEAAAMTETLGDVPVTALKGFFGNLGAGGGAVEMAAAVAGLNRGQIPPTINHTHPDPDCRLNLVTQAGMSTARDHVLLLTHTTMGQAAAVVLSRPSA